MKLPSHLQIRSSLLDRLGWSSVLGLSVWSLGMSNPGILLAQTVPVSVRSGYSLLDQGLVNQAISQFERVVRQLPESIEARLGLAIAYRRAGRDANAFQTYEQALAVDPTNRLALISLGVLGGFRVEWQQRGITALTTLLQHNPNDQEARTQRALLYIYEGQFDDAIADYELILQQNPDANAVVGAAQAYAYSGNYAQSLTLFDRYLQSGGQLEADAATAYSRALRETGNARAAVQLLDPQLRQRSISPGTAMRMRAEQAVNYAAMGQLDLAKDMLAPLKGQSDARMVLGRALVTIGKVSGDQAFLEEGIALFQLMLMEDNIAIDVKREIAETLAAFPQSQLIALKAYRDLALAQPESRGLQTQIAVLEFETKQLSEAELSTKLSKILPTLPSDPTQQRLITQALIQLRTPNPNLLPLYENLVRAGMTEPLLYFRIAQMYLRQRDYETARSVIATYQATPSGKIDPAAELLLALIDQQQGDAASSMRRYQAIINSNPSDRGVLSGALQGLAGIYQGQKQYTEALALYFRVIALNPDNPAKKLGQTALRYQAGQLKRSDAEAVLKEWLTTQPLTETPPELYSLVGALPAVPSREFLYRTLVQADPSNIAVQLRLLEVMVEQNQPGIMTYVNGLVARDPENVDVYFLKGHIAQLLGNLGDSATAYEAIVALKPDNVDALSALGGVRFRQRRYEAAVEAYSKVLELQPNHTIARGALSNLELARHRRIPALRQAREIQQADQFTLPPDLNRLQSQQPAAEFVPQGTTPLPWE